MDEKSKLIEQATQELRKTRQGAEWLTEEANENYVREATQARSALEQAQRVEATAGQVATAAAREAAEARAAREQTQRVEATAGQAVNAAAHEAAEARAATKQTQRVEAAADQAPRPEGPSSGRSRL